MVLEAIYEGHFEDTSHGFRPHRSCHTALNAVQKTFTGKKWFIERDIKGFFDNVNHEILSDILKVRISDERSIRLIRKIIRAGYLEQWRFHGTYSGMPQGLSLIHISFYCLLQLRRDKFLLSLSNYYNESCLLYTSCPLPGMQ